MKVFISSVRTGLEIERDALPGLIRAIGHEPIRFEDFTAQPIPSREACLRGVDAADVYILLLGSAYGATFPETGKSATHEEYVAATTKGIPRLVFRKNNVDADTDRTAFITEVETYSTGLFRGSFDDAVDLQSKVVTALNALPGGALTWTPLEEPPDMTWMDDWDDPPAPTSWGTIEVHAVPVPPVRRTRREIDLLPDHIAGRLRTLGIVASSEPIHSGVGPDAAWATIQRPQGRDWHDADPGGLLGCRVAATGQLSIWDALPSDSMGALLDENDLIERVAGSLRVLGGIDRVGGAQYGIGVAINTVTMTVIGDLRDLGRRSSVSGFVTGERSIRCPPDETVTDTAFGPGATEAATPVVRALLADFARQR